MATEKTSKKAGRKAIKKTPMKASKASAKKAKRPTKVSSKRQLIAPRADKRYVRRDKQGQFSESDDQGKSLSADVRQNAKRKVKAGQGDKGDQK